jgi:hypothetical protein
VRFRGKLYKDGRHWLAEVPVFDALTQGRTREEALAMIDERGFSLRVHAVGRAEFGC